MDCSFAWAGPSSSELSARCSSAALAFFSSSEFGHQRYRINRSWAADFQRNLGGGTCDDTPLGEFVGDQSDDESGRFGLAWLVHPVLRPFFTIDPLSDRFFILGISRPFTAVRGASGVAFRMGNFMANQSAGD
jgi:hypothetical protein